MTGARHAQPLSQGAQAERAALDPRSQRSILDGATWAAKAMGSPTKNQVHSVNLLPP